MELESKLLTLFTEFLVDFWYIPPSISASLNISSDSFNASRMRLGGEKIPAESDTKDLL